MAECSLTSFRYQARLYESSQTIEVVFVAGDRHARKIRQIAMSEVGRIECRAHHAGSNSPMLRIAYSMARCAIRKIGKQESGHLR